MTIKSPAQNQTSYGYDNLDRMTRVTQSGVSGGNSVAEKRVDFVYRLDGSFDQIDRYDNLAGIGTPSVSTHYGYDLAGRLITLEHESIGSSDFDYAYTYDVANRIDLFTTIDGTTDYSYDANGQLLSATGLTPGVMELRQQRQPHDGRV